VLVDDLGLASQVLVLLACIVFALVLDPDLDLISRREDTLDVFFIVVGLHHGLAALSDGALQTGL
jgi:hypothetical protein